MGRARVPIIYQCQGADAGCSLLGHSIGVESLLYTWDNSVGVRFSCIVESQMMVRCRRHSVHEMETQSGIVASEALCKADFIYARDTAYLHGDSFVQESQILCLYIQVNEIYTD
jgi:hypothetical protein